MMMMMMMPSSNMLRMTYHIVIKNPCEIHAYEFTLMMDTFIDLFEILYNISVFVLEHF